ncbi:MFS transporter [Brevibacillus choshinensis]|uniref:MFS transporter n=1 Tax=Brevibacillus choshinensis TaxID=54911 RepID=A0ABX7FK23_BRECH|nr:MFS transporter [Brevibacillus choshinensis]QRG65350.1 MFS transporter [Brevibacillus choshinensis]
MKEVFQNRNFRNLFFANLFSGFGQGMTMIGISWYLVETSGSASLLGSTMLISSILTLLAGPYLGTLVDRFSRKTILQAEHLGGFLTLAVLAAWGFRGDYEEWMLVLIFLAATLLFQLHEPTQAAFIQETFEQKDFRVINSLLEIENQTALVLAGAFAGFLLAPFGLHIVLVLNALTYLCAYLLMSRLDYVFARDQQNVISQMAPWTEQFLESWLFIRQMRGFLVFGVAALIPFISVMLVNLLNPIFVSQTLREDVHIYSLAEVTYSIGAAAAGFLFTLLSKKVGSFAFMVGHYLLMAIALILTIAFPNGISFILLSTFVGWCNVSTRLTRQTLYMVLLPNHFMGRVMSFFRSVGTLIRLLMLALFTMMIDSTGAAIGYLIVASLLGVATMGIIISMSALLRKAGNVHTR